MDARRQQARCAWHAAIKAGQVFINNYGAGGGIELDYDADGGVDASYARCTDAGLASCD